MSNEVRVTAQDILDYLEDSLRTLEMYPGNKGYDEGYRDALQTSIDEINGIRAGRVRYVFRSRRRATKPS
jgi:hypothetical protein